MVRSTRFKAQSGKAAASNAPAQDHPVQSEPSTTQSPAASTLSPAGERPSETKNAPAYKVFSSLEMELPEKATLAVFQRGNNIWIVLGGVVKTMPQDEKSSSLPGLEIERYELKNGTAYRLICKEQVLPVIKTTAQKLTIDFVSNDKDRPQNGTFEGAVQTSKKTNLSDYIFPNIAAMSDMVTIKDPEIGDNIFVVPTGAVIEKGAAEKDYVQFHALPTLRGFAFLPKIDDLQVRPSGQVLSVSAPSGLLTGGGTVVFSGSNKRTFPLSEWLSNGEGTIREQEMALEQKLIKTDKAKQRDILLQLAQLDFANSRGPEANGWLQLIANNFPESQNDPAFLSLRGAVAILSNNAAAGEDYLKNSGKLQEPEIALWRAYGAAEDGRYADAKPLFQQSGGLLYDYLPPFNMPFLFAAADTAAALDDIPMLDYVMNALDQTADDMIASDKIHYDFLRAQQLQKKNMSVKAKDIYDDVIASNDAKYKLRAQLELINIGLADKTMKPEDAAQKLDAMRFAWRGDDFERTMLNQLATINFDMQKPRSAIDALNVIVRNFAGTPDAEAAKKTIQDRLMAQFNNQQTTLSPIEEAALYQDYNSYITDSAANIQIKQHLADKMSNAGLPDQAASWLQDMIDKDLSGADKSRTMLKLAGVRILGDQTDQALTTLDQWAKEPPVPDQAREAALLRARVLMTLKKYDLAREQIKKFNDDDANKLKVDIEWRAGNWRQAADAIGNLLPATIDAPTDEQAQLILNRAVALTLANDPAALQQIRDQYKAKMDQTRQASAFDLVTRPSNDGNLASAQIIKQRVGEIDLFKNFLQNYGGTSAAAVDDTKTTPEKAEAGK